MWRVSCGEASSTKGNACCELHVKCPHWTDTCFHTSSEGQDVVGLFPRETIGEWWSQIIYNLMLTVRGVDSHSRVPQIRTALETGPTQILDVTAQGSGPPSSLKKAKGTSLLSERVLNTRISSSAPSLSLKKEILLLLPFQLYFLLFHRG